MSVWSTRRARALVLAAERPHAAEILRCYAAVTVAQEKAAELVPVATWWEAARARDLSAHKVRLAQIPVAELAARFADFLTDMEGVGTDVMIQESGRLAASGEAARRAALEAALALEDSAAEESFHARAFLEVVATALAGRVLPAAAPGDDPPGAPCRVCGAAPLLATLRDLPGVLGSGGLVCSRCAAEQRVPRLTCVYCGETDSDRLRIHSAESVPHVRLDECGSCRRYIKTVDLRSRGDAVPVVEDLATPELDLWARDHGLVRERTNLFGI